MKLTLFFLISTLSFSAACTSPMDRDYTLDRPRNAMFDADLADCKISADNDRLDAHRNGTLAGVAAAEDEFSDQRRDVVIRCLQNCGHTVSG